MKKRFIILLAGLMILLCGCNLIDQTASEDQTNTLSEEELYAELNRAINSPTSLNLWIWGTQTFTAAIISEPQKMTLDSDDGMVEGMYQAAVISRNVNDYFVLNVTDLQEYPKKGDFVRITGLPTGSIYWTEEVSPSLGAVWTKDIHVLDVKVKSFELFHPDEINVNTTDQSIDVNYRMSYRDDSGKIEFINAHFSEDDFGKLVVVYFNFTNTGNKETDPLMNRLWFSLGDNNAYMTPGIYRPNEVDSNALSAYKVTGDSMGKTSAGKTDLYYAAFKVDQNNSDTILHINRYDDDFNWTNSIAIDIAPILK